MDGLTSFIVTLRALSMDEPGHDSYGHKQIYQFWAEDTAHAGEQADDAEPYCAIILIETQAEYEDRTGVKLDY